MSQKTALFRPHVFYSWVPEDQVSTKGISVIITFPACSFCRVHCRRFHLSNHIQMYSRERERDREREREREIEVSCFCGDAADAVFGGKRWVAYPDPPPRSLCHFRRTWSICTTLIRTCKFINLLQIDFSQRELEDMQTGKRTVKKAVEDQWMRREEEIDWQIARWTWIVCFRTRAEIDKLIHTYVHTCMHTCIHAYMHRVRGREASKESEERGEGQREVVKERV